jgi:deoxyuridine 5'-triphosphate nucleotidohydrolase
MLGDRLFGDMSRPEHAYALGVTAMVGKVRKNTLEFQLPGDGEPLLSSVRKYADDGIKTWKVDVVSGRTCLVVPAGPVTRSVLGQVKGPLTNLAFPSMGPLQELAFCRGLFDAAASVTRPDAAELKVRLVRPGPAILSGLVEFTGVVPSAISEKSVQWSGVGALDLLGILYDGVESATANEGEPVSRVAAGIPFVELFRNKLWRRYRGWCSRVAHVTGAPLERGVLCVQKVRSDAVLPSKGRVSDSGYDLTIVHSVRTHGNITLYGTGVSIDPPQGWYFDVIARSSLVKLGYMVANCVGVIDRAYRGEIMVPLVKVDPAAPDIVLPARVAQLIPRPIVHFPVVERAELTGTHRGKGGFGSTGPA